MQVLRESSATFQSPTLTLPRHEAPGGASRGGLDLLCTAVPQPTTPENLLLF